MNQEAQGFRVIHPMDDIPEQKCSSEGLGRIQMTLATRVSLSVLLTYLILMALMLLYHVVSLSGQKDTSKGES